MTRDEAIAIAGKHLDFGNRCGTIDLLVALGVLKLDPVSQAKVKTPPGEHHYGMNSTITHYWCQHKEQELDPAPPSETERLRSALKLVRSYLIGQNITNALNVINATVDK